MRSTLGPALLALALSFAAPGLSAAEELEESEKAHLFPRSTYAWPFATGPVYGDVDASRWSEPGVLHTMVGSFDLKRGSPALPDALRAGAESPYVILQVDPATYADGRFDRIRGLLESQGGALLEAMAVGAYLIRANPPLRASLPAQDGVLAVEPYHPAFKLAPTIGRVPLADPAQAVSDVYRLEAVVFRGEDAQQVASSLKALGAAITRVDPDVVFFELSSERLADVARLHAGQGRVREPPQRDARGRDHGHGADRPLGRGRRPLPRRRDPRDDGPPPQILMVLDSGLQLDAADLSDTRTSAGTAGPAIARSCSTPPPSGAPATRLGCDAGPQGGFTHGHVVAAHGARQRQPTSPRATARAGWPPTTSARAGSSTAWLPMPGWCSTTPRSRRAPCPAPTHRRTRSPWERSTSITRPGSGSLGDAYARGRAGVQLLVGYDGQQRLRHQRAARRPVPVRSPRRGAVRLRRHSGAD